MTPRTRLTLAADLYPGTRAQLAKVLRVSARKLFSWVLSDGRYALPTEAKADAAVDACEAELLDRLAKVRQLRGKPKPPLDVTAP